MKKIPMPKRIKALPIDDRGRPVPYFVYQPDHMKDGGAVDFRVIDPHKLYACWKWKLCWVCGQLMGVHKAFTIGPMCCVNRVSAEPPSHLECAEYSVQVCPFLSEPRMARREEGLPEGFEKPSGEMLPHNPGTTAIWVTKLYHPLSDGRGGHIFRMGEPESIYWWHQGQEASREDVLRAVELGLPALREMAKGDGPEAERLLEKNYQLFLKLIPQ